MALWRYEIELPNGERRANLLAAGNRDAALERAERNARAHGGKLVGEVVVTDPRRGSM